MIAWLLSLFAGKTGLFVAAGTAIVGVLGYLAHALRKSGVDAQKVKEAEADAKKLRDIQRAGNAMPTGSVLNDPRNRDRKT